MIRLIAAIDEKRGIAKGGRQPWKLPGDERYFKRQTLLYGGVVVMGRTTYDSIGHALTGRTNIVASHHNLPDTDVTATPDLQTFLSSAKTDIWVIGGADIYAQALPLADELYLTEIDYDFGCDQFFPNYEGRFTLGQQSELQTENGLLFHYKVYRK